MADESERVGSVPLLSVVIPMHNEASSASQLLSELRDALQDSLSYEVVVVDDGSEDATYSVLRQAADSPRNLRVVRHKCQSGQSAAILSGVKAAKGDWIVTLDGDGQNDPADIKRFLAARDEHPTGGRGVLFAGFRKKRQDTLFKRLQSRVANAVRARLLKDGAPDTGCGLKMFERSLFLSLPHFDHMHRFLPALVQRAGASVISVEVGHRARHSGNSHYGIWNRLWAGVYDMFGVMWLQKRSIESKSGEVETLPR